MGVHDFDVRRGACVLRPLETNAPLLGDTDAELPCPVAFQAFKAIAEQSPQILETCGFCASNFEAENQVVLRDAVTPAAADHDSGSGPSQRFREWVSCGDEAIHRFEGRPRRPLPCFPPPPMPHHHYAPPRLPPP